jgi:hypothetical protein
VPQSVEADVRGHSNPHRKRDLIAAAVAGIVIVVGVLLIIFWPQQPTNKPDIGGVVQTSMQDFCDTDPGFASRGLTVVKVSVVRADGSRYDGVAVIRARNGAEHNVPVQITADGRGLMWQTPPWALAPVLLEGVGG